MTNADYEVMMAEIEAEAEADDCLNSEEEMTEDEIYERQFRETDRYSYLMMSRSDFL